MLKRVRFFFSASLVAAVFASTLILSIPSPVKACPPPPPKTLLELYLQSDLIFVADLTSQKDGKIEADEKDYLYLQVTSDLRVSSVLKGKPLRNFIFTRLEFRNKNADKEDDVEGDIIYFNGGYKGYSELKVGEKYLFFFKKDAESNEYELTDSVSGYKKLDDADLYIHKKRIEELKSIINKKENQLDAITDWFIRLIEEPSTRWDGAYDLNASFQAWEYEDKEESEEEPFVIDENFSINTPEIARNLSDSQKEFISSIAFSSIQQEMSEGRLNSYYYSLSHLVSRWDKTRLVMFAYSFLQTADKSDAGKIRDIMEYISGILDDNKLYDIVSDYPTGDPSEDAEAEEVVDEENAAEPENKTEEAIEISQQIEPNENAQAADSKQSKPQAQELTLAQKQENTLQKFISRYEYLLARNFVDDKAEEEWAENINPIN